MAIERVLNLKQIVPQNMHKNKCAPEHMGAHFFNRFKYLKLSH